MTSNPTCKEVKLDGGKMFNEIGNNDAPVLHAFSGMKCIGHMYDKYIMKDDKDRVYFYDDYFFLAYVGSHDEFMATSFFSQRALICSALDEICEFVVFTVLLCSTFVCLTFFRWRADYAETREGPPG